LAELLTMLVAGEPAVIGVDLWRDVPVPKSGAGLPLLNRVLLAHSNIVGIFTPNGIRPPTVLASNPERIAFNDNFPVDVEVAETIPKVRRSLLFADVSEAESYDSLPFRTTLMYLETMGIGLKA
jgi:CHASE2 domain-containing sensor protein